MENPLLQPFITCLFWLFWVPK